MQLPDDDESGNLHKTRMLWANYNPYRTILNLTAQDRIILTYRYLLAWQQGQVYIRTCHSTLFGKQLNSSIIIKGSKNKRGTQQNTYVIHIQNYYRK